MPEVSLKVLGSEIETHCASAFIISNITILEALFMYPSEQTKFRFMIHPKSTNYYNICTISDSNTVVVLHEYEEEKLNYYKGRQ